MVKASVPRVSRFETLNRACDRSRQLMFELRSSGPWTPLAFSLSHERFVYRRYPVDGPGVRVAFLTSNF